MKITSTRLDVIEEAYDKLRYTHGWYVNICRTSSRMDKKLEFGLNWTACGTQTTYEARKFQKQLRNTVWIVERLNELGLEVEYVDDPVIDSQEQYDSFVGVMTDYLNSRQGLDVADFVENFLKYAGQDEPEPDEDDDDYYTPSATRGDYSPSCPWKAPGMSVSDFI